MDTTPPSLTSSPVLIQQHFPKAPPSPAETSYSSESSARSYPSPADFLGSRDTLQPHHPASPFLASSHVSGLGTRLHALKIMAHPAWISPADIVKASGSSDPSHPASTIPVEYDSFAAYQPGLPTPFSSHESYLPPLPTYSSFSHPPPSAGGGGAARAPLLPSFGYLSDQQTPRLRSEDASYCVGLDKPQFQVPALGSPTYATDGQSFPHALHSDLHDKGASSWGKQDCDISQIYGSSQSQRADMGSDRRVLKTNRTKRPPRKHTTKEEANFQCEVKGCGKFFSRSYNYKSHLETHDEKREYPFPCPVDECTKKFVRKTDLQRHHQSVHMKERNHKCDYCNRLFARKDTLRRHMEDGCSKRFDIGTLNLQGDGFEGLSLVGRSSGNER